MCNVLSLKTAAGRPACHSQLFHVRPLKKVQEIDVLISFGIDLIAKNVQRPFSAGSAAFEAAVAAVGKYGGASAGHRTLLDALIPASTTLQEVM